MDELGKCHGLIMRTGWKGGKDERVSLLTEHHSFALQ